MTAFAGSALVLTWTFGASGTLDLNADYRTFQYQPSQEFYEETAGTAPNKEYIASMKAGQANWGGVVQGGSLMTFATALTEGQLGTLVWCPEGTANGKYHGTAAFFSQGFTYTEQYNQLLEASCAFMQTGTRSEGTVN